MLGVTQFDWRGDDVFIVWDRSAKRAHSNAQLSGFGQQLAAIAVRANWRRIDVFGATIENHGLSRRRCRRRWHSLEQHDALPGHSHNGRIDQRGEPHRRWMLTTSDWLTFRK